MMGNGKDFEQNINNKPIIGKLHKHQFGTMARTLDQDVRDKFLV